MPGRKNATIALVLGFALTAAATPVLAQSSTAYDSRAEAIASGVAHRAEALRECNEIGAKSVQYTWGVRQSDQIRACTAQHGEVE